MTDKEIIKALDCCGRESCLGCPYRDGKCHQGNPMIRDALDLITRQQAENDTLKNVIKNSFLKKAGCNIDPLAEIKSEAYKEFADRLKETFPNNSHWIKPREKVDNLLKEMAGENNDL